MKEKDIIRMMKENFVARMGVLTIANKLSGVSIIELNDRFDNFVKGETSEEQPNK